MNNTEIYSEILDGIPDKRQDKNTTSLKFKTDLIDYFRELSLNKCIEVGTNLGYSTRVLSHLFNEVFTIEHEQQYIDVAMKTNSDRSNINYFCGDVYNSEWDMPQCDASFIDCVHTYDAVQHDIYKSIEYGVTYLIFDDYGIDLDMKRSIDDFISTSDTFDITFIGEPKGNEPRIGKPLHDWEGVIIKIK